MDSGVAGVVAAHELCAVRDGEVDVPAPRGVNIALRMRSSRTGDREAVVHPSTSRPLLDLGVLERTAPGLSGRRRLQALG